MTTVRYQECLGCKFTLCELSPDTCGYNNLFKNKSTAEDLKKSIKSDGGSSSYYDFTIPSVGTLKTEQIIRYMVNNDFDLGNVIKCCRRITSFNEGVGKEGNDELYDWKKIKYTAEKRIKEIENGK